MNHLSINPSSRLGLDAYLRRPSHALLLSGEPGAGLHTVASQLATELVRNGGRIQEITADDKGLIAISDIRSLYKVLRSKEKSKRVVLIDNADLMSIDAQNAFLKLLEEPNPGTYFILTSHTIEDILETVRSRCRHIQLRRITGEQSQKMLDEDDVDQEQRSQLLFLASGYPAEMKRLLRSEDYFETQKKYIVDARKLLQSDRYSRLRLVLRYTDRWEAKKLLYSCQKLILFSVMKQKSFNALQNTDVLETTIKRIDANAHLKTQLAYLVTKLR